MPSSKWRSERSGPDWLMDEQGRVIGYRDERGNEYAMPNTPKSGGFNDSDEPSQLSSDAHPGYVFYIPGRQQVGLPVDRSGKGRNMIRKAQLSEAASWATLGWLSSVVGASGGNDGIAAVVDSACVVNWPTEVVILAGRVKMAAPAANTVLMGTGSNPTPHGVYVSGRTSGRLLIGVSSAEGFYNTGEVPGVVLDNTEHAFGLFIDGPNKSLGVYLDGGLAFNATGIAPFGTVSNLPLGFAVGAPTYLVAPQASAATTVRELHMLKLAAMPLNMDDIMLKLASGSGALLASDVKGS